MKAYKIHRNNETYIEFEKMKFDIKARKTKLNFENLFNGDPILGTCLQIYIF